MFQIRLGDRKDTRGTAFVIYEDIYDAKAAVDHLSGFNVGGRYLVVLYYQPAKFERKEHEMMVKISEMKEKLAEAEEKFSCNNLVPTPQSPNVSLVDPTVVSDLREEVELFRDQINQLKEENSRLKAENDEMNHLSHSHRLEITELKNSMEEKEDELASYRESLRQVFTGRSFLSYLNIYLV